MDPYEKEVQTLTELFEQVPTDFSDSDTSEADSKHESFCVHDSQSEQAIEESDLIRDTPIIPSVGGRAHLQYSADGIKWNRICFPTNVRTKQENLIVRLSRVNGLVKKASTILETWQLFVDHLPK